MENGPAMYMKLYRELKIDVWSSDTRESKITEKITTIPPLAGSKVDGSFMVPLLLRCNLLTSTASRALNAVALLAANPDPGAGLKFTEFMMLLVYSGSEWG